MSRALTRAAEAAFRQANAAPEIAVIVFAGAGRAFCAGDDLKEFGEQSASPAAIRDHVEGIQAVTRAMMLSDKSLEETSVAADAAPRDASTKLRRHLEQRLGKANGHATNDS